MATGTSFRPPKQWLLSEQETITPFANWQSNILYHLSLCDDISSFLDTEWSKKSVTNRGLQTQDDKTPTQRNLILDRMLNLIRQSWVSNWTLTISYQQKRCISLILYISNLMMYLTLTLVYIMTLVVQFVVKLI